MSKCTKSRYRRGGSMGAAIPFISYGTAVSAMEENGVKPAAHIDKLLSLLDYV